jgi:anti-anti-sigma factor
MSGHAQAARNRAVPEFRVDVEREHGGVRVCPLGEVDMATIGHLRERMDDALADGEGHVILDLRGTTFLDSKGLHLAVDTDAWAARTGREFTIIAGPPAVQRTFEVAGLTDRLPFADGPPAERRRLRFVRGGLRTDPGPTRPRLEDRVPLA